MPQVFVDGLPGLGDASGALSLCTRPLSAIVRSPLFIASFSIESGKVAWAFERLSVPMSEATRNSSRRIQISGSDLWNSEADDVVAELSPTEDGGALVSARRLATGRHLWEYFLPIPEAADWAEPSPAWPGAQTEGIDAFFASDPTRLVVCLSRQSRTSCMYSRAITVDSLPAHASQLDAICLDTSSGVPVWRESFPDVAVGIIERRAFSGIWSNGQRVGVIDFHTGTNRVLHEYAQGARLAGPRRFTRGRPLAL